MLGNGAGDAKPREVLGEILHLNITGQSKGRQILYGMALIWLINLLHALIGYVALSTIVGMVLLAAFTVIQLLYGICLVFMAWNRQLIDAAKGMIIAVSVTTLLSSTCTYLFFDNLH